ncbi:hypothetical protein HYC85_019451 [Camellia sinensis]|uniref:F-box domain-containing protein n=1 Tax=Camellia sinensis TaxID=4442 RepID=A0A7J7GLX5_CAMSI|nr:hypothetical protein HYC85_019451 [Camellia sinensis]
MSLSYLVGCLAAMSEPPNDREFEQGNSKKNNPDVEIEVSNDDGHDVDRRGKVMETTGKKRKKRKREPSRELKTEEALLQDPLTVFGSDIMTMILRHLNAPSVALSLLTSRTWYGVASSDSLWKRKEEEGDFRAFLPQALALASGEDKDNASSSTEILSPLVLLVVPFIDATLNWAETLPLLPLQPTECFSLLVVFLPIQEQEAKDRF